MNLIMNERKYAEYIMDSGDFGTNASLSLFVLAKYFAQCKGMKKKAISVELDKIMSAAYPGYIKANWVKLIEKAASNANKYPIVQIDSIPVTQSELDIIAKLTYSDEKKLAFTMLVIAKFFNMTRSNNNNWVNVEPKTVFKHANVNQGRIAQAKMYAVLTSAGILKYSKKTGSTNAQVVIIDNDGDPVFYVEDLRSLGHWYAMLTGSNYRRCKKCGLLIRQSKTKPKIICSNCESASSNMRFRRFNCIDCNAEVFVAGRNTRGCRCPSCQTAYRRQQYADIRARKKQEKATFEEDNLFGDDG